MSQVSNPHAVILAVVPAAEDVANSEALKLAQQVDRAMAGQFPGNATEGLEISGNFRKLPVLEISGTGYCWCMGQRGWKLPEISGNSQFRKFLSDFQS